MRITSHLKAAAFVILSSWAAASPAAPVDGARIQAADREPGNWMSHGRSYDEQRYSPLAKIDQANVGQLGLAWTYKLDVDRGVEATPIVVDGVMFTTGAYSIVYALDARSGKLLWKYDPKVPREWAGNGCCDVVNRGVAAWKGKIYVGSFDGRLIALDAKTGKPAWTTDTVIDRNRSYTITGAPRVVKDKVIIGNGGAEMGVRGYVSAYDAATGKLLWRFFTVPGDPKQPPENKAMEMAQKTWSGDAYVQQGGGGTVWDSMAYDAELDLLYIGTGNGSMWNRKVRSPGGGDNLFLSSIIALKPDSGEYVWHYQTTPGDTWDYTATQHIILADLRIKGELRKVLMQAPKNAFFYVIDRKTGELISAEKFAPSNWASHVDMKTGRPVENPEADWTKEARLIFPSPFGAHNWQPMSFNPKTGLVYIPMQETLILLAPDNNAKYVRKGIFNVGLQPFDIPEDPKGMQQVADAHKGHLLAWDPVAQKAAWDQPHVTIWNGGTLSTAGNLVFQGSADGRAVAYAADTGKKLWEAPRQHRRDGRPCDLYRGRRAIRDLHGRLGRRLRAGWRHGQRRQGAPGSARADLQAGRQGQDAGAEPRADHPAQAAAGHRHAGAAGPGPRAVQRLLLGLPRLQCDQRRRATGPALPDAGEAPDLRRHPGGRLRAEGHADLRRPAAAGLPGGAAAVHHQARP